MSIKDFRAALLDAGVTAAAKATMHYTDGGAVQVFTLDDGRRFERRGDEPIGVSTDAILAEIKGG